MEGAIGCQRDTVALLLLNCSDGPGGDGIAAGWAKSFPAILVASMTSVPAETVVGPV